MRRRFRVGAEPQPDGGVHFRVWAPRAKEAEVVFESLGPAGVTDSIPLECCPDGYFEALVGGAEPGMRYRFRLDRGDRYADPASRFQPEGPHGPSEIIDPFAYQWTDNAWSGVSRSGLVVYEMHIGTFTQEGTWQAAARELAPLAELGVTMLEIMPVADFPGEFGWGYDGVNLFAPTRLYGTPDDFRAFVDTAHQLGLGVVLDVVYNHFGPDGCWLDRFSPHYFSDHATEWGQALNFDGEGAGPVRELFIANAGYWIEEFHLDGLRLDATQSIVDASEVHILREIGAEVRRAAGGRTTWIVAENEPQRSELSRPVAEGGLGLDALWNDDFHHSAMVALTGKREAYYTDYFGTPQEFVSAAKYGFLYQGQYYSWQSAPRGTPGAGLAAEQFVTFLQNHDQVANSWSGLRIHALTSPGKLRALTALLLLGPSTPMLFQGQEFAASAPFLFFADHQGQLAALVRNGRRDFLSQFTSVAHAEMDSTLDDPAARSTFERCKLDLNERDRHATTVALHASLLQLRSSDAVFRWQGRCGFDGAVLGPQTFVLRYFSRQPCGPEADDRLIVINLGVQCDLVTMPEPLLAPPAQCEWQLLWSSEDPIYGGGGTPDVFLSKGWRLPAECALVFKAVQGTTR